MKEIDLNPHKVGNPRGGLHGLTANVPLTTLIELNKKIDRERGWGDIEKVCVAELPEGLPHSYVLVKGGDTLHHLASTRGDNLPCVVVYVGEMLPGNGVLTRERYDSVVESYLNTNRAIMGEIADP